MKALDLFAGPGGWDVAARELGLDPLGIEYDDAACATREAAGLRTHQADVSALDPADFAPCELLIASPPCQAWSMAGKRQGEIDKARVMALAGTWAADPTAPAGGGWADDRSPLAAQPIRWASVLRPRFMAWEQVPPVLELWSHCAQLLEDIGYRCWTGILSAERFGVPQTRKRAILMAALDGPVHPPQPTHQRYVPGEPARHEHTLEGELLPWISMAEALEGDLWPEIPAPTVTAGGGSSGGTETFGRGGRRRIQPRYRRTRGSGMSERHGTREDRPMDEPAPTVTGKSRSDEWVYVNGNQENAARRPIDAPAPTVMFGHNKNEVTWTRERPATTVTADPRIARPGHHGSADERDPAERSMTDSISVTVEQAAALQSFPPDHPWQGSKTKQHEQVGNAVPPLMARAILEALTPTTQEGTR